MPLPIPSLDDRSFDQLVREGRALIPRYTDAWTNHNASDPGITLLELFAYLIEAAIFELDQTPRETLDVYLELAGICRGEDESTESAIARALDQFERTPVALTAAHLGDLAKELSRRFTVRVQRAELVWVVDELCRGGMQAFGDPDAALVNVVLSPGPIKSHALEHRLYFLLKQRAVVGTRLHVVRARYARARIRTSVARERGSTLTATEVENRIRDFIDPIRGGVEGSGWPMGRTLYRSELFQVIQAMAGVDHVESLDVGPAAPGAEGVHIGAHELIDPDSTVSVEVL